MTADPILIEATRGPLVERRWRGAYAVVSSSGSVVETAGDVDRLTYPRSTYKIMQALPLVESGAAEGLGAAELALACASHSGQPAHAARVRAWLASLGLDVGALQCGTHSPLHKPSAAALREAGAAPDAACHQCSGKHTGFLAATTRLGGDAATYLDPDSPVQRAVQMAVGELCEAEAPLTHGVDGCAAPNFAIPLRSLALGMAKLAGAEAVLSGARRAAAIRLRDAMHAEPFMVSGEGRADLVLAQAAPGAIVKAGANGKYAAILPERGLGIAVALEDGASGPNEAAIAALLIRYAGLDPADPAAAAILHRPVNNWRGDCVGRRTPTGPLSLG